MKAVSQSVGGAHARSKVDSPCSGGAAAFAETVITCATVVEAEGRSTTPLRSPDSLRVSGNADCGCFRSRPLRTYLATGSQEVTATFANTKRAFRVISNALEPCKICGARSMGFGSSLRSRKARLTLSAAIPAHSSREMRLAAEVKWYEMQPRMTS